MIQRIQTFSIILIASAVFVSCKKDTDPVIVVPASNGAQVQLNGLIASEPGSSAGNSVYLDLSGNRATPSARAGWDLGFYCGPDFRVILNHTSSAGAKVLSKYDLASVDASDTIGLTLAVNPMNPQPSDLLYFDEISGNLQGTVIPGVSTDESLNNVVVINRGTGGSIAARPWMKIRVNRNATGGYILQYARITETTYRTIEITKDNAYHFIFFSFDSGIVDVQPEKYKWDLVWTYSLYQSNFGWGTVPYNFSDMIAVNHLSNVMVKEKIYADAATANAAYTAFGPDSLLTTTLVPGRWTIGSSWRSTMPATGARRDRFYIIKDAGGNYYKFKALAMGIGTDGGTRGRPEFSYELIQ